MRVPETRGWWQEMLCRNVRIPHSASRYPLSAKPYKLHFIVVKWVGAFSRLCRPDKTRSETKGRDKKKKLPACVSLSGTHLTSSHLQPFVLSLCWLLVVGRNLAPAAHRPPAWAESIRNRPAPIHRLLTCSREGQWENPLSPFLFLDKTEALPRQPAKTWIPTVPSFSCGARPGGRSRKAEASRDLG